MKKLTYTTSGVNYKKVDFLKRLAQKSALQTDKNIHDTKFFIDEKSRGESACILQQGRGNYAFVQEGLGTKNLVADEMYKITGKTYYDSIAQDCVAAIVNDLITVGARPLTVFAYWAAGSDSWFLDKKRMNDLVKGWQYACNLSFAAWGGGETPTLPGITNPTTIDLAGSAFGVIPSPRKAILGDQLTAGDVIILFESSGIHTNGLSLARTLTEQLSYGYQTKLTDGRTYGESLLNPTIIYVQLIQSLLQHDIDIHYMVHITGHGWRKVMRHTKELTYHITHIPPVPLVLQFIQQQVQLSNEEAYGTLNMGAGFAIFVPQSEVKRVLSIAKTHHIKAFLAGAVEKGPKQVIIEPKDIVFEEKTLQVR